MTKDEIISGMLSAELTDNGIGLLDLGPIANFENIKSEVDKIIKTHNSSYTISNDSFRKYIDTNDDDLKARIAAISAKYGKPNKTNEQIVGAARIYKLFRETPGWFEDCKDYVKYGDINNPWKFHYSDEYPAIAEYISTFPNLVRFWINGLMPGTRFVPHREILSWRWNNKNVIIPRIHIPFLEDPTSVFNINGYNYNLKKGHAYFVNIGSYHYAANNSEIPRYHFLIDCILSHSLLERFQNASIPNPISYEEKEEIDLAHNKRSEIPAEERVVGNINIL
jgi:hypothetical protein